jgi:hypothetical protein
MRLVSSVLPWQPNATRQARLEAEAKRKLEAVACTRLFGPV